MALEPTPSVATSTVLIDKAPTAASAILKDVTLAGLATNGVYKAPTMQQVQPFTLSTRQANIRHNNQELQLITSIVRNPQEPTDQWEYLKANLNLDKYLGINARGEPEWGSTNISKHFAHDHPPQLKRYKLHITIKDPQTGQNVHHTVDLAKYLINNNGHLEFHKHGTCYPDKVGMPGFVTDPLKDGNIEARAFTVASDVTRERCRIAYKTQVDDRISMAEALYQDGRWREAEEIETWASKMPGDQFALVFDPVKSRQRHLIFSEPDGDGYIYFQTYRDDKWGKPKKPRDLAGREMAIKAHRFSGFAATFDAKAKLILFYFVDESNALLEYAGKYYEEDDLEGIPAGYRWTRTQAVLCQNMTLREHISAICKDEVTYVIYRARNHDLMLQVGTGRKEWNVESSTRRNDSRGNAYWTDYVIRNKDQLAKDSPLSVAIGDRRPKVFYLHKERKTETIKALEIRLEYPDQTIFEGVSVGKLEPGSDICSASLPTRKLSRHDVRCYSVSKLDGDNVLLERIQLSPKQWAISGGIVDTDIDHLEPRSLDKEHTNTDDN